MGLINTTQTQESSISFTNTEDILNINPVERYGSKRYD